MMRFRLAAVLLACVILLSGADSALAAGSKLSTAPPSPMPAASQSAPASSAPTLPRTGLNVGLEGLLAAMLLAGGIAFRVASPARHE